MFKVKLYAPEDKSLLAEITRPIDDDTPERSVVGHELVRYFVPAGEKVTFSLSPGDEIDTAELDPSYKSLKDMIKGEDLKRQKQTLRAAMPEVADILEGVE